LKFDQTDYSNVICILAIAVPREHLFCVSAFMVN